jgi:hypothetical protein
MLQRKGESEWDERAVGAVRDKADPERISTVRDWLRDYGVFQGIPGPGRVAIATTFLEWADCQVDGRPLRTVDELVAAHAEVCATVQAAYGEARNFTSLASKALWLRYPDAVPLFDSFAQRALWVIAKIDEAVVPISGDGESYSEFVYVWMALYKRYAAALESLDREGLHRVRIFDRILWLIGDRRYSCSEFTSAASGASS